MTPTFTGRIVEWDDSGGCGWVETDGQRIFLHIRDFRERRGRPAPGRLVCFTAGRGPTGLTCARDAVFLDDGRLTRPERSYRAGQFGRFAALLLLICITAPAWAIAKLPVDPRIALGYPIGISLVAYWLYAVDKRRALAQQWRISESSLHLVELIGGWPGAFVAQRRLRHKCSKRSYQAIFWMIVLIYQYVAFDVLRDGPVSRVIYSDASSIVGWIKEIVLEHPIDTQNSR